MKKITLLLALSISSALVGCGSSDEVKTTENSDETSGSEVEQISPYETEDKFSVEEDGFDKFVRTQVYVAEQLVTEQMKDAESTKFRNWSYVKADVDLPPTVCGEVNSENSMGAMAGFRKFLIKTDTTEFGIERTTKGFDDIYNEFCVMK